MMRREFIVAIAGTVAWPLGARAQPDRMRHVGPRRQSHRIIVMSAFGTKRTSGAGGSMSAIGGKGHCPDTLRCLLLTQSGHRGAKINASGGATLRHMKVEEIAEVVAKLPPDQLARFRRWFIAFEAGRTGHSEELDSAATKLGRFAGRAFAELKRRTKDT